MADARRVQTNFSKGELSPNIEGRPDLAAFFEGASIDLLACQEKRHQSSLEDFSVASVRHFRERTSPLRKQGGGSTAWILARATQDKAE